MALSPAPGGEELALAIKAEARSLGFSRVGITSAEPSAHVGLYRSWLGDGMHGEMAYLGREESVRRRADLDTTLKGARSVVAVAHDYYQEDPPGVPDDPSRAVIARYARGDDYHDVIKGRLLELLSWLGEHAPGVQGRAYVDTGPVLERDLAQRSGLGWLAKNTMLIDPAGGSYFFVGLLLLDIALPPDTPLTEDRCGSCRSCPDACPTGALLGRDENGAPVMDARLCISYLTIELRQAIPVELRAAIGNRVYGCDICQEVCPWNERFAEPSAEAAYSVRDGLDGPSLLDLAERLLSVDDEGFRTLFKKSAMKRGKRTGLLRNVCVALGNWGSEEAVPVLARALQDPQPLVRGHAAWALGRVGSAAAVEALSSRVGVESDPFVLDELDRASGH